MTSHTLRLLLSVFMIAIAVAGCNQPFPTRSSGKGAPIIRDIQGYEKSVPPHLMPPA